MGYHFLACARACQPHRAHDLRIDGRISERRGYRYSAYFGEEVPAAEWKPFAELETEMGPCAGEVFRG